ncbi:MAG: PHB depolymerase family esterase [Ignavibacteriota bacterium]
MKKLLILTIFLCISSDLFAQKTISDSLVSGGRMRYYNLYLPKNFTPSSVFPLVIHLHGYASNVAVEQYYTNYMPIADTANFLVVYPLGTHDQNGDLYWNVGLPNFPTVPDDVAFISELIESLHSKYSIDRSRVYASGLSNGGYLCYQLAWKLSNKIAAIASVSGSMTPIEFARCKPVDAVPVMEIHGTADNVVPYTTSPASTDIDSLLHFWVLSDGCIPLPGITDLPNIDPLDGSTVTHYQWSAELRNTACELYKINGGAHMDWPGVGAGNNNDFIASVAIWQFFSRFQNTQSEVKQTLYTNGIGFYPNPCSDILHISVGGETTAVLIDACGRQILSSAEKEINTNTLPSGCYVIRLSHGSTTTYSKLLKF